MESSITSAGLPARAQSGKVFFVLKLQLSLQQAPVISKSTSQTFYIRERMHGEIFTMLK